jgi:hypothetical protein
LASGAARTTVSGVREDEFQLELSGASTCDLSGDADRMDATLGGASRATISGAARQLTVECSGASQLDAKRLAVEEASVELSGASTGFVNASKALTAEASGASSLRYRGQPTDVTKQASGASTIVQDRSGGEMKAELE